MTASMMDSVKPVGVGAVEPLHTLGEIGIQRLDDEMEMVRHQHPRSNGPSEPLRGLSEEEEKRQAIAVRAEDWALLIAAGSDVVESISEFNS
jgi:hypothetical protein